MKSIIGNQMNRKMRNPFIILVLVALVSCGKKAEIEKVIETSVPVTITHIDTSAIESFIDLNATTIYLVKNTIKANTTGYIEQVNVVSNDYVKNGQLLFLLKTREAKVLGNTINKIDPSLNFGKPISIRATSDGYINAVNSQKGDYVQEGDALGIINDAKSFSIVLSLPYELKRYVTINTILQAFLPDGTIIQTKVDKFMPTVDPASQTQNVILKCLDQQNIPENLIVKIRINKSSDKKVISLPKSAVLTDETETDFWIMKLINNTTAVKVPIKKGIVTADKIEILSPSLLPDDRILLTGNYGVGDTIKVKILNK